MTLASAPLPTLMLAAFATLAVAGCGVDVSFGDETRRVEHETVPVGDLRIIDVETENGAVEIIGGGGDEVTVRTVVQERREGDAVASIVVDGDRLVINGECESRWWSSCSVGFEVTVPSELEVDVVTENGRVDVENITGDLRMESDNGAISAIAIGSSDASAITDNGRIHLAFADTPTDVRAETDNGAISVSVPDPDVAFAVDADTDNGAVDLDVKLDPTATNRITASSDNGAIEIEYRTV